MIIEGQDEVETLGMDVKLHNVHLDQFQGVRSLEAAILLRLWRLHFWWGVPSGWWVPTEATYPLPIAETCSIGVVSLGEGLGLPVFSILGHEICGSPVTGGDGFRSSGQRTVVERISPKYAHN
jgi:hypothetical protein